MAEETDYKPRKSTVFQQISDSKHQLEKHRYRLDRTRYTNHNIKTLQITLLKFYRLEVLERALRSKMAELEDEQRTEMEQEIEAIKTILRESEVQLQSLQQESKQSE